MFVKKLIYMGKALQEEQQNLSCSCVWMVVFGDHDFFLFLYFLIIKRMINCRPCIIKNIHFFRGKTGEIRKSVV